jgi:Na+/pantothenate symporter
MPEKVFLQGLVLYKGKFALLVLFVQKVNGAQDFVAQLKPLDAGGV